MKRVLAAFILTACATSFAQAQTIRMQLGHYAAVTHPGTVASRMFAEGVEQRTQGKIRITVYPDNELGTPDEVLSKCIRGAVDMALPSHGHLGKYARKFYSVMLPYAFDSYAQADRVLDGPFTAWAAPELESSGLVFLSNWEWGFRHVTSGRRPVNSASDIRGLMVRTPPEPPLRATLEALGAVVALVNFTDLRKVLAEGVIDGQENPIAVIYANRIYETQKYLALTGHVYNSMVHVINRKAWNRLTPEQQGIVREESAKAGAWMRKAVREAEAGQIAELAALGMQVSRPDRAAFKSMTRSAYGRLATAIGEDNIREFQAMVDEAR
jgi:tripartite ATP-independent transporter DctP family solute receptor